MSLTGAQIVAKTLKRLGVQAVFGIVGIPVVEVGDALIEEGIRFISFRNEQSASYAASAYGYLTGQPGVLLVVGGPGVVHAGAGILNSNSNKWPLVVIAGSSGIDETNKGAFQELDQISLLRPYTKFCSRPLKLSQLAPHLFKAYKDSMLGVPGTTYIDLPADLFDLEESSAVVERDYLGAIVPIDRHRLPKSQPPPAQLQMVADVIKSSKSPLVVVGKGAAYANAAENIRSLVADHSIPFLPTPMGKGVVSDHSELNVSSARSMALRSADVVLLLGARLNWILHFGEAPRFRRDVKFIQVDQSPEEIGNNAAASFEYGVVGDLDLTVAALNKLLAGYTAGGVSREMQNKIAANNKSLALKETTPQPQLNYNIAYKIIRDLITPIEKELILITEGANTMDVARISFPQEYPKQRLDAGTNATMGIGLGYSIAAKLSNMDKTVLAIQGDSAFGFSGLEIETAVRSHLPMIIVVMNNSGIYHGIDDKASYEDYTKLPSTALSKDTRYDILAKSLGAEGYLVTNEQQLLEYFNMALDNARNDKVTLLNVIISPGTQKKVGFGWQNKKASKL